MSSMGSSTSKQSKTITVKTGLGVDMRITEEEIRNAKLDPSIIGIIRNGGEIDCDKIEDWKIPLLTIAIEDNDPSVLYYCYLVDCY
jgi:hypothetical protein